MNFKKILSLFMGLNIIGWTSISVLGCETNENKQNKIEVKNPLENKINLDKIKKINVESQKQKNILKEQIKEMEKKLQDKTESLIFFQENYNKVTVKLHQAIAKINKLKNKLKMLEEYNDSLKEDSYILEQKLLSK